MNLQPVGDANPCNVVCIVCKRAQASGAAFADLDGTPFKAYYCSECAPRARINALDEFTTQYIVTALWASLGDDGVPLDKEHEPHDLTPEAIDTTQKDCARFQAENSAVLEGLDMGTAGHDFWLSRNGHGAGYFDGDQYDDASALLLQDQARRFGTCDLYKGDDGKLYIM